MRKSLEVPAVHGGCQNWSTIYLGVISPHCVRVNSCRKVLDWGRSFESTYIMPRFCQAVLHCLRSRGKN